MTARYMAFLVSGPAKATWQRTHTAKQKADRKCIVRISQSDMEFMLTTSLFTRGVVDSDMTIFGSAQGLLNAMHEYQRMAPKKFNDSILGSIMWYKVPIQYNCSKWSRKLQMAQCRNY